MAGSSSAAPAAGGSQLKLLTLFGLWYLGNYYYNIYNKVALNEAGGKTGPFPYTIATAQLGVGFVWALASWTLTINPITLGRQIMPKLSFSDCISVSGVSVFSALAHLGSVLTMNAGSVAFGQIVKAAEPVFAALVNTVFYGKPPSMSKALMLPIIVLGVAIACLKPDKDGHYKVEFEVVAVVAGSAANLMAAFKGSENARLMSAAGIKVRARTPRGPLAAHARSASARHGLTRHARRRGRPRIPGAHRRHGQPVRALAGLRLHRADPDRALHGGRRPARLLQALPHQPEVSVQHGAPPQPLPPLPSPPLPPPLPLTGGASTARVPPSACRSCRASPSTATTSSPP